MRRTDLICAWAIVSLFVSGSGAFAQSALRCSGFLHQSDGAWRSFSDADLFGPNGVVHVRSGEILHATANSTKGELARALNDLCEGH